jgi:hypothetical protein
MEGNKMKMDKVLINKLTKYFEERFPKKAPINSEDIVIEDYDKDAIWYHVALLYDNKLIDALPGNIIPYPQPNPTTFLFKYNVNRLTYRGHMYLEMLRKSEEANPEETKTQEQIDAETFDLLSGLTQVL